MPTPRKLTIGILILVIAWASLAFVWFQYPNLRSEPAYPRRLGVDDEWNYRILFPDSKGYDLTERVIESSGTGDNRTFVILRNDSYHISTTYLWITSTWFQLKTFRPYVGNIVVNYTETYNPPPELFRVPFNVGDRWEVKTVKTTVVSFGGSPSKTVELIVETRTTEAIDQASTPMGQLPAYKVTVALQNGTVSETLWFNLEVGNIVRGEYYNGNEKVTQTLASYSPASAASAAAVESCCGRVLSINTFSGVGVAVELTVTNGRKSYLERESDFTTRG